ncbi:hypothetical protein B7494_g5361 [Chlorociboria aeruginascens]|nr:hypothetical protein B7494_g5361 [Chlorociboria aeruginascens]
MGFEGRCVASDVQPATTGDHYSLVAARARYIIRRRHKADISSNQAIKDPGPQRCGYSNFDSDHQILTSAYTPVAASRAVDGANATTLATKHTPAEIILLSTASEQLGFTMAALDVDVFRSKQFVFIVGENQAAFTAHAAIIAKQSKALDVLINGSMGEASEGKAIIKDIEEDTFMRFCQFAYTGDYTTPDFTHIPTTELPYIADRDEPVVEPVVELELEPEPVEEEPAPEPEPEPEPVDGFDSWGLGSRKVKKQKKPSKGILLRQKLGNLVYDTETSRTVFTARCEVRQNSNPTEDYTRVFLGHAQLYVFAEQWGIDVLKTLALSKLHKTLTSFTLYEVRRPDIVELLRYTFSNDHTPDRVGAVDDLRSLVMLYTACEVESLVQCPEFLSLVGEGGQLAQNLVQMLMKRIR